MELQPGSIYEGSIGSFGHEGALSRWIVISPFGKTHCHSIDDPFQLHCMPLAIACKAVEEGSLTLLEHAPYHPVMELQREKERMGISDSHLGLSGAQLKKMLDLLHAAAANDQPYLSYAVGELLSFVTIRQSDDTRLQVYAELETLLNSKPDLPGSLPAHLMTISSATASAVQRDSL